MKSQVQIATMNRQILAIVLHVFMNFYEFISIFLFFKGIKT